MSEKANDRVSVNRREFEAFIEENQQLVERYEKMVEKVAELTKLKEDLEEKLKALEKSSSIEREPETEEADEILRRKRAVIERLIREIDRQVE
jgi:cell division septum initiation protein DivIVA